MDNVFTIVLKDKPDEHIHKITFESNPTCTELAAACLVLEEVMEHNFTKAEILSARHLIYGRLTDLEEERRTNE